MEKPRAVDLAELVRMAGASGFELQTLECFVKAKLETSASGDSSVARVSITGTDQSFPLVGTAPAELPTERIHARVIDFESNTPKLELIP